MVWEEHLEGRIKEVDMSMHSRSFPSGIRHAEQDRPDSEEFLSDEEADDKDFDALLDNDSEDESG